MQATKISERDRLTWARILLASALVICAGALLLMSLDASLRPDTATAKSRRFVRLFGLSSPAIISTTRPGRHPDAQSPAVDLRHDPRLPIKRPDAGLVFRAPGSSSRRWAE